MLHQPTIDKLLTMRLTGMVEALRAQEESAASGELSLSVPTICEPTEFPQVATTAVSLPIFTFIAAVPAEKPPPLAVH